MLGEGGEEGGRLLPPSRRPDGTLRKEVRIRSGYTPQDEVERYVPKGSHPRRSGPRVPPGSDPAEALTAAQAKSKAAKKNEKRKAKKTSEQSGDVSESKSGTDGNTAVSHLEKGMDALEVSGNPNEKNPEPSAPVARDSQEGAAENKVELEKKLRALRKKLRQAESLSASPATRGGQMTAEEADKLSKLEPWQREAWELEAQLSRI